MNCAWPIKLDLGIVSSASYINGDLVDGSGVIWPTWVPCRGSKLCAILLRTIPSWSQGRNIQVQHVVSYLVIRGERLRTLSLQVGMQPPGSKITCNIRLGY
ncbi:hypothetical protein HZ326_18337 [Fusarium oxysporum f. sp. albedinis]|nr:hypothetical protein HZ326_18337 [Fusarium oxysporum f. sp. albedinis]